jgi:uncharacterized protein YhaN
MFNNSCATAIDRENYEIIDLRTLRIIRKNAETIRAESFIPLNKSKLRDSKEINSFESFFNNIKTDLNTVLTKNGYTLSDARINIYNGGSKTKSKRRNRSNKKSKRRNNRKTYKKKLRKTYKKRR